MSTNIPHFATCEGGLSLSPIPIWILDIETIRVVWANPVGLTFWQAETLEELIQRDMLSKAPEAVLVRLRQTISRLSSEQAFQEDWTFFPKGKPMPVILHLNPIVLSDGRMGMLNQAVQVKETASASTIRALTMLRHTKATTVLVDSRGSILAQNAGAGLEFEQTNSWAQWIVDANAANDVLRRALSSQVVEMELTVHALLGERIHSILAHELRDPVEGENCVLIQHFDVTERVEAERMVQAHLAKLREQQHEILALSTPFLNVGAKTLALPLIGRIDEVRAAEMTSRLLEMVANHGIERVILDITGVVSVDASSVAFLRRLVDAIALLGAKPIVTGIRSDLARMLAASDENLSGITIKKSLADGLTEWHSHRQDRKKKVLHA